MRSPQVPQGHLGAERVTASLRSSLWLAYVADLIELGDASRVARAGLGTVANQRKPLATAPPDSHRRAPREPRRHRREVEGNKPKVPLESLADETKRPDEDPARRRAHPYGRTAAKAAVTPAPIRAPTTAHSRRSSTTPWRGRGRRGASETQRIGASSGSAPSPRDPSGRYM